MSEEEEVGRPPIVEPSPKPVEEYDLPPSVSATSADDSEHADTKKANDEAAEEDERRQKVRDIAVAADDDAAKLSQLLPGVNVKARDADKSSPASDDDKRVDDGGGENQDVDEDPAKDATPEELVIQAMSHKEDGNSQFKAGDYDSSARSYRKGTNLLKKLNEGNTGDEQVKQLLITLQTNLSMVCYRQKKHKLSRDVASKALEVDSNNVKALYRRAVAHRAMGDVDAAKSDLKAALSVDPDNTAVKKELISIKMTIEESKAKEKARLQRAFSKKGGGSLLYSDKAEEEKRKEREKKEKEKLEKEALEKRKVEWENECVRRMASDPPEEAISYEDWDKERKAAEEAEEKARKKAKKEEDRKEQEERRKAREAQKNANNSSNNDNDSDDDELTEKELAMLRGYKKTSDGRTTSYFTREQTEDEKKLIGCIKPKRLDNQSPGSASPSSPSPTAVASGGGGGGLGMGSVWNQSGTTWEEKDTTDWCKKCLEQCLLDTTAAYYSTTSNDSTYVAVVKKVVDMTGDASVAIAGGKKRYIYDFHTSLEYEVLDEGEVAIASGTLRLPDVNSATTVDEDELEVDILSWKKVPSEEGGNVHAVKDVTECRKLLVHDVRKAVLQFVEKFNTNF